MQWWKRQQQQDEANTRTDNDHQNKRFMALDESVGGLKEGVETIKKLFAEVRERVDGVWERVETLWNEREKAMADLTALKQAVDANTAAVSAAMTAINNLVAQGVDPSVIAGFTSQLQTNNTALQNAVAAVSPPPATGATAPATPPATTT